MGGVMTDEQKAWEELVARGIKDIGVQVHGEYMDRVILSVDAELKRLREDVEFLLDYFGINHNFVDKLRRKAKEA